MANNRFASVWDAIDATPELGASLRLRSMLMIALKERIARSGMSSAQAAELLGVTQTRVCDLLEGKINRFDLEALVNIATTVGLSVELNVRESL